ncbi:MAG: Omp28-related outer membrane protein [Bacteroidales bacterium]|nr:Omp28-related outer membrane protein [Bacteroidales bacterium]
MKTLKIFLLLIIAGYFVQSCDKIDPPYTKGGGGTDTVACPVPDFPINNNPIRKVMIEEFTGHQCPNCPQGQVKIKELKVKYGEQLNVVAIHAGVFSDLDPSHGYTYDFRTAEGTLINDDFDAGNLGYPSGMINRIVKSAPDNRIFSRFEWEGAMDTMMAVSPFLDLQIITDYDSASRKLCTHVQTEFLQDITKNVNLVIFILEDSIISKQQSISSAIDDYVHSHVLRGTVSGAYGKVLSEGLVTKDTKIIKSYKTILPAEWDAHHISVLAFVYYPDDMIILQSEAHHIY